VSGTLELAGVTYPIDCFGHRDHSWGGERDWSKFHRWNYLSGELGRDFWFNAVRIDFGPEVDVRIGCVWDGRELLALSGVELAVETADGGTRQLGVEALTAYRGRDRPVAREPAVRVPEDLDAVVAQVDDPVLRNTRRSIDRRFREAIRGERRLRNLDDQQRGPRVRTVVVLDSSGND